MYLSSLFLFEATKIKENSTYKVTVINDIKVDDYTSFLGRVNTSYIKVYLDENIPIKPGDKLEVEGLLKMPVKSTIPNTFDYSDYLKSQGIKYTLFSKEVELTNSTECTCSRI